MNGLYQGFCSCLHMTLDRWSAKLYFCNSIDAPGHKLGQIMPLLLVAHVLQNYVGMPQPVTPAVVAHRAFCRFQSWGLSEQFCNIIMAHSMVHSCSSSAAADISCSSSLHEITQYPSSITHVSYNTKLICVATHTLCCASMMTYI